MRHIILLMCMLPTFLYCALTPLQEIELQNLAYLTHIPWSSDPHLFVDRIYNTETGWLSPANKERWETTNPYSPKISTAIVASCSKLGMFDIVFPIVHTFDYLCILGATLPAVHKRISFAVHLWNSGIRWKHWVLLTGDRPLSIFADSIPLITQLPHNETEGMQQLFVILQQSMPPDLQKIPHSTIHTPQQITSTGLRRPNTEETIRQWIAEDPSLPGQSCCFCSTQPFILRQRTIVDACMSKICYCETVGPAAHVAVYITKPHILLDELARWLYNVYITKRATA